MPNYPRGVPDNDELWKMKRHQSHDSCSQGDWQSSEWEDCCRDGFREGRSTTEQILVFTNTVE